MNLDDFMPAGKMLRVPHHKGTPARFGGSDDIMEW